MNKDLTVGNPSTLLWKFCLPLFGSVIFQQLYTIADSLIAGKYIGIDALAAVGNSYEITLIFIAFVFGCNIGCSVIVSRYFGAKEYEKLKSVISTSVISSMVLCIILMILGLSYGSNILHLINTPSDIFSDSKLYLDIYIYGLPFMFLYNISNGIFSGLGDSRTPFIFLVISSIANIFVDIIFVKNLHLGIKGVALATLLCQGVSCILALIVIFNRLVKITSNKFQIFSFKLYKEIISISVPSTIQQSFISVGNIIIQGFINSFGSSVIAGYSAAVKLENLVVTSLTTLGNGISNYTAQNLGAQKIDRINAGYKASHKIVWILSSIMTILYFFFSPKLILFFMKEHDALTLKSGVEFLRILSPFYFIIAAKLVNDGSLRGMQEMRRFMIATLSDLFLRVILAWILSKTSLGYLGIWISWPIGWLIGTILSIYYYKISIKKYYRT